MGFPGAVATLAGHALAAMLERQLGVSTRGKPGGGLGMAGGAHLGADVVRSVDRLTIPIRDRWRLLLCGNLRKTGVATEKQCCKNDRVEEQAPQSNTPANRHCQMKAHYEAR